MTITGVTGATSKALYIRSTGSATGAKCIRGVTITGAAQCGISIEQSWGYDTVIGCRVLNIGNTGIEFRTCLPRNMIANNIVAGWQPAYGYGRGIYIIDCGASSTVCYNTVLGPTSSTYPAYCLHIDDCGHMVLYNNILYNRSPNANSGCLVTANSAVVTSDCNDLYKNTTGGYIGICRGSSGPFYNYATLQMWRTSYDHPDTHSISRDPQFVNLPGDLHIAAASPCIDSATPVLGVEIDIDSDLRDLEHPDIGADEYYPVGVVDDDSRFVNTGCELAVAPNPFIGTALISYNLPRTGDVVLKLYDVAGNLVRVLAQGHAQAGVSGLRLQLPGLTRGLHFLKLETEGYSIVKKLVKALSE